ncbi:GNAT family N-acetyltransferase [Nocardioides luteus]|uniref:GNAT family N-acetyltransferase n=1 Tax=Nocardioides luteus TaxID=1844 RepID=UPI0002E00D1C|nr:GNAT family N-acetyltransferase [Nocardioides luteus]MBG6095925.1 GNAT superfamily N-acetyltransferase [Nocardioides luteus]
MSAPRRPSSLPGAGTPAKVVPTAEVRVVVEDEWPALKQVRLAALQDTPEAYWDSYEEVATWPDERWRLWAASGAAVIAWVGDKPSGLAAGIIQDDEHHMISMWLAPDARGHGLAEALVHGVADWARRDGATVLTLWVVDGNESGRRLYERIGFELTGDVQPFPEGDPRTESKMALRLT